MSNNDQTTIVSKSFYFKRGETMDFTLLAKECSGNRFIVSPARQFFSFSFIDMISNAESIQYLQCIRSFIWNSRNVGIFQYDLISKRAFVYMEANGHQFADS